jgi:predicted DsbA family dithiol-disulfide isomerase
VDATHEGLDGGPEVAPEEGGTRLEVIFDYVDPGSWMALALLDRILDEEGIDPAHLRWRGLELRPPERPPLDPGDAGWRALTEAIAAEAGALGIPFSPPEALPRTRKALELAAHGRERGAFATVHQALFQARFEGGEDLGRVDTLVRVAEAAGLDGAEARTVLGVDRFREAVESERARLLGEGIRGVPTLRYVEGAGSEPESDPGGRTLVLLEGYPGAEAFRTALDEVVAGFRRRVRPAEGGNESNRGK